MAAQLESIESEDSSRRCSDGVRTLPSPPPSEPTSCQKSGCTEDVIVSCVLSTPSEEVNVNEWRKRQPQSNDKTGNDNKKDNDNQKSPKGSEKTTKVPSFVPSVLSMLLSSLNVDWNAVLFAAQTRPDEIRRFCDLHGSTTLHHACRAFRPHYLFRAGGWSRLENSLEVYIKVLKVIIEAHPEALSMRNREGDTPLMVACYVSGHVESSLLAARLPSSPSSARNYEGGSKEKETSWVDVIELLSQASPSYTTTSDTSLPGVKMTDTDTPILARRRCRERISKSCQNDRGSHNSGPLYSLYQSYKPLLLNAAKIVYSRDNGKDMWSGNVYLLRQLRMRELIRQGIYSAGLLLHERRAHGDEAEANEDRLVLEFVVDAITYIRHGSELESRKLAEEGLLAVSFWESVACLVQHRSAKGDLTINAAQEGSTALASHLAQSVSENICPLPIFYMAIYLVPPNKKNHFTQDAEMETGSKTDVSLVPSLMHLLQGLSTTQSVAQQWRAIREVLLVDPSTVCTTGGGLSDNYHFHEPFHRVIESLMNSFSMNGHKCHREVDCIQKEHTQDEMDRSHNELLAVLTPLARDVMALLIHGAPQALSTRNVDTQMYPFMLPATGVEYYEVQGRNNKEPQHTEVADTNTTRLNGSSDVAGLLQVEATFLLLQSLPEVLGQCCAP